MSTATDTIEDLVKTEYKYGFVTDVETESAPPGLSEDTIRMISRKKNEPEWLLDWRLKSYRHWLTMTEPTWPNVTYPPIDFQDISYYSAPKAKKKLASTLKESGIAGYLLEGGRMAELPAYFSNQVPINATPTPDTLRLILGDWSQVLLGIWSEVDILVNPFDSTAYARGGVLVRAMSTVDIAVRHPTAFVHAADIAL